MTRRTSYVAIRAYDSEPDLHVRNNVDKAWNNIDVILQQRNDELVKLIDTCRGYMQHEAGLLDRITEMRSRYTLEKDLIAKADAENQLQLGLSQLRHVWEAYPELRATENFSASTKLHLGHRVHHLRPTRAVQRLREHLQHPHRVLSRHARGGCSQL